MNKRLKKKKGLLISNEEMWSLDFTFAKYILPRLKRFRQIHNGYPCSGITEEEWESILNKMIWSFDYIVKDLDGKYFGVNDQLDKQQNKQCQEGLDLFAKYFRNLWD